MVRINSLLLIVSAFCLPNISFGQIFGPDNYDDCIIEGMQGVTSDIAARAILVACRDKFPIASAGGTSDGIGWEVGQDGIGMCHLKWDGASFSETVSRSPPSGFTRIKVNSPREILLVLYIPDVLMEGVTTDDEQLQKVARLFGEFGFPYTVCGNKRIR